MTSGSTQIASGKQMVLILIALAMGTFTLGLTEFSVMPMLPLVADSFAVSAAQSGHIISAYALGVVVGAPLLMLLTPTLNRRTALVLFALMIFVFNGLSAAAASFEQIVLFRFLSGIPHGAYFGTALLFGAKLAPEGRSTLYMSRVFTGLTIATIVGVPVATLLAQHFSWRWSLVLVSLLALLTCLLLWRTLPSLQADSQGLRSDLAVLKNPLVWPIVGIAVIGFGGVFCLYTYLADTMLDVTKVPDYYISIAMVIFGVGSTVGNWLFGQVRDRVVAKVTGIGLIYCTVLALVYVQAANNVWFLYSVVFLLGASLGLTTVIQAMLMRVAKGGHAVIGALLQCAFNSANAIGPLAGSMVLAKGYAANSTGYVAAALFAGGFVMWFVSRVQRQRQERLAVG
ncbi:MFS transporter [Shewanella yunxiaonensis]|uniref:MFS transporter n=1 Tax=Shewanella yunxiaonensis TaxID=2829809 RepID=A0ABX7YTY1_9GAMM|nr:MULTISPECIES: MFS transporter [Shewanella]MDF0534946.1 MFS transporter [Shewanella sp. A32]QUN06240.1 MFS transporter [Shewanella yunxiaonensis]